MSEQKKEIVDLQPDDYRSDRVKPREPIFGRGAGPFLGELTILAATIGLFILIALLATYFKGTVRDLLSGEKDKPSIVRQNGYIYHLQPDGSYK